MSWYDRNRFAPIRRPAKFYLVPILFVLVAGCQPLPQPFADPEKADNPIVVPTSDVGGITILPIAGVTDEKERALSAAMTDALLAEGIIAGPDSSNLRSKFLQGAVTRTAAEGRRARYTILWDLFDGSGKLLKSREMSAVLPANYWLPDERRSLRGLMKNAAADIARIARGDDEESADKSGIALRVAQVTGGSDNAAVPLRHAMEAALRKRHFRITDASSPAGLVVAGAIELGPEDAEPRPIRITWSVLDRDGKELGKLTQQNTIERRELENRWDSVAAVIADNAAGGLSDLVVRLPPEILQNREKTAK